MQKNVGGWDKGLRIVAGALLVLLTLSGTLGAWGWLGLLLVLTGALGWCPAYPWLGITTCKTPDAKNPPEN